MRANAATMLGTRTSSPSGGIGQSKASSPAVRREHVELHREPGAVLGAHVHRQRLGDGAQPARLLGAVDPDFERDAASPFSTWPTKIAKSPNG